MRHCCPLYMCSCGTNSFTETSLIWSNYFPLFLSCTSLLPSPLSSTSCFLLSLPSSRCSFSSLSPRLLICPSLHLPPSSPLRASAVCSALWRWSACYVWAEWPGNWTTTWSMVPLFWSCWSVCSDWWPTGSPAFGKQCFFNDTCSNWGDVFYLPIF